METAASGAQPADEVARGEFFKCQSPNQSGSRGALRRTALERLIELNQKSSLSSDVR